MAVSTKAGGEGIDCVKSVADADLGIDLLEESDKQRRVTAPEERSFKSRATAGIDGADLDGANIGRRGPSLSASSLSFSSTTLESATRNSDREVQRTTAHP